VNASGWGADVRPSHTRALRAFEQQIRARNLSLRTAKHYLRAARRFLATLDKPLARVEPRDVRVFLAARAAVCALSAQATEHYQLRAFLRAALEAGLVRRDPMAEIAGPAIRTRAVGLVLSEAAVERLLLAASAAPSRAVALRDRALVELAYGSGLRRAELSAALLVDLDLQAGVLRVRRAKRGRDRLLPLPPASLGHLRAWVEEGRPTLAARGRGRDQGHLLLDLRGGPLRPERLTEAVQRIARRTGSCVTPHALRRSIASHLVRAGASIVAVQELLGHERLDTTAVYVAVEQDDLRAAVAILERARSR
jgi:site-specific recombinase XerD